MRFASIDIGSNAVRLLFANVFEDGNDTVFKKESLIRVPVRLGQDAFTLGEISMVRTQNLIKTMKAFKHLMEVNDIVGFKACATAAMREAKNGEDIIQAIKKETGIEIEIVSGQEEAHIIYSNHIEAELEKDKTYIYIDVGGGSTEMSLFHQGKLVKSHSFPIGTLRILNNQIRPADWETMKKILKKFRVKYGTIFGIGSGGNINKLHKIYGSVKAGSISRAGVKKAYKNLTSYSYAERVRVLGLKPDRADVIVPATEIFMSAMKWANIPKIYVPKIGLSDGLIHLLYEQQSGKPISTISSYV